MEQALEATNEGQSKIASSNKAGTPWGMTLGPVAYHVSSDKSLFSSSLPVLQHEKLIFSESSGERCVKVGDRFPELSPSRLDNELKDPLHDLEPSPLGSFLPGDEDELLAGIVNEHGLSRLPAQLEDLEDDLFGSGGGLELETGSHEHNLNGISNLSLSDGIPGNIVGNRIIQNGGGSVSGEHPYGEHPSRTLFVRNINSNIDDSELQAVFEQFGEIRTLYTACKHRGFVMVSYYDIRAARTAMRSLQNKPMRRRKLDIHFSIPKDNPTEKDINQGTLVVFNLDLSVSNEDLHQIFTLYGEVKEIRETPHKRQHKFVEFYDVRAAEAALKALNRIDIAGKRIKLELSRPGGARRSMVQQPSQDMDRDDARAFSRHLGSPIANSLPGSWPNFGSPVELNRLNGYNQSPNLGLRNSMNNHHVPGLASILPQLGPIPAKISPIGKESERVSQGNQVFLNVNSTKRVVNEHSHPNFEQQLGSSPGVMEPFTVLKSNSSSIGTLSGPEFLWGSPTIHSELSLPSSEMCNRFAFNKQGHGYPYPARQGSSLGSHHHVGSAPTGVPLQRHFGFFPESPKTSYISPDAFSNSDTYPNESDFLVNICSPGVINMGMTFAGNFRESGCSSSRLMMDSRNKPLFLGNGSYGGVGVIQQNELADHGRNRRVDGNQNDNKKQFQLDLEKIISGEDTRTTLMIKNIPNKYTSKMLLAAIDETHKGTYDFLYLPIDFKNKCNVGYAFINIVSPSDIITFYEVFHGKKWEKFNSEKVASLAYARIQGKVALVTHFQNSSLMNEDKQCQPILFHPGGQGSNCQEVLLSSSLNMCIQQPDGYYSADASGKPKEQ